MARKRIIIIKLVCAVDVIGRQDGVSCPTVAHQTVNMQCTGQPFQFSIVRSVRVVESAHIIYSIDMMSWTEWKKKWIKNSEFSPLSGRFMSSDELHLKCLQIKTNSFASLLESMREINNVCPLIQSLCVPTKCWNCINSFEEWTKRSGVRSGYFSRCRLSFPWPNNYRKLFHFSLSVHEHSSPHLTCLTCHNVCLFHAFWSSDKYYIVNDLSGLLLDDNWTFEICWCGVKSGGKVPRETFKFLQ